MDKKSFHSRPKFLAFLPLLQLLCALKGVLGRGQWDLLLNTTGVVATHMVLTHHDTVILFDQSEPRSAQSGYPLRRRYNGTRCRGTRGDLLDSSCYAHSIEYDVRGNKIRPLNIGSDACCSSGSILSDGRLVQIGGLGAGSRRFKYFEPCQGKDCDWRQGRRFLSAGRLYASSQILPDKEERIVVVGGREAYSYEFVPKRAGEGAFSLPFLHQSYDRDEGGENLYPIIHLSSDGRLFVFANRDSILLDYKRGRVAKTFPRIPGNGSRSYPSTGSSVILPLDHNDGFKKVEVLICGGASSGAYEAAREGTFLNGLTSCGRMVITGNKHKWDMEYMPRSRLMNDMLVLPTGHVLIINGAKQGCAGLNSASNPSLQPYLYKPKKPLGKRFSIQKSSEIARMYHSSAALLPDGRVLVAGSNPNKQYAFKNMRYPTELRLQAFVPSHMGKEFDHRRPWNVSIDNSTGSGERIAYGGEFTVDFFLKKTNGSRDTVSFTAYSPPFTTHSIAMNQRMLLLRCKKMETGENGLVKAVLEAPPSPRVAPSGYYMLSVVNGGIPSIAQWIRFMHA